MAPPELAADAPVLNICQPMVVNLGPAVGMKFHPALGHAGLGFRHGGILQKPLFAQARFDGHIRALAEPDVVLVRLGFNHHALFRENFHGNFAGLETIQSCQWPTRQSVHRAVGVDDFDERQLMARADVEVRLVVGGRDLEHAGAEFKIHMLVADDGDEFLTLRQFSGQRPHDVLADKMRVTRVFRIHGHGGVAGNRLGARGGDGQPGVCEFDVALVAAAVCDRRVRR